MFLINSLNISTLSIIAVTNDEKLIVIHPNYDGSILQKTYSVTIAQKVTVATFSYSSTNIDKGKTSSSPTKTITGTAKSGPTYSSSNTSIATVNSSTGIVTGVSAGTATITISYTNYDGSTSTKTCTVTIKSSTVSVTSWTAVVDNWQANGLSWWDSYGIGSNWTGYYCSLTFDFTPTSVNFISGNTTMYAYKLSGKVGYFTVPTGPGQPWVYDVSFGSEIYRLTLNGCITSYNFVKK